MKKNEDSRGNNWSPEQDRQDALKKKAWQKTHPAEVVHPWRKTWRKK